jgi:hypothetical protein
MFDVDRRSWSAGSLQARADEAEYREAEAERAEAE